MNGFLKQCKGEEVHVHRLTEEGFSCLTGVLQSRAGEDFPWVVKDEKSWQSFTEEAVEEVRVEKLPDGKFITIFLF